MRIALALGVVLLLPATTSAQLSSVSSGDTVRVWTSSNALSGAHRVVSAVHADSIELLPLSGTPPPARISAADIRRVDVQRGRHSRWRGALIWGLIAGTAAASVTGSLTHNPGDREATLPLAGWAGFAVGAVIGGRRDPSRWVTVYNR